jgi:anti-sigma factor RsiW
MSYSHIRSFLSDEELFGTTVERKALPSGAARHLEQCEDCQKELAEYTEINAHLLTLLYRRQCPSGITLSAYCADMLPNVEMRAVERHLRECPLCVAEAEDTRRFLAVTENIL